MWNSLPSSTRVSLLGLNPGPPGHSISYSPKKQKRSSWMQTPSICTLSRLVICKMKQWYNSNFRAYLGISVLTDLSTLKYIPSLPQKCRKQWIILDIPTCIICRAGLTEAPDLPPSSTNGTAALGSQQVTSNYISAHVRPSPGTNCHVTRPSTLIWKTLY